MTVVEFRGSGAWASSGLDLGIQPLLPAWGWRLRTLQLGPGLASGAGLGGWAWLRGRAVVSRRVGGWRLASGCWSALLFRANPGRGAWTRAPSTGPKFRGTSITASKDWAKEEERKAKGPNETGFWARRLTFKTPQLKENGRDTDDPGRGQKAAILPPTRMPGLLSLCVHPGIREPCFLDVHEIAAQITKKVKRNCNLKTTTDLPWRHKDTQSWIDSQIASMLTQRGPCKLVIQRHSKLHIHTYRHGFVYFRRCCLPHSRG